MSPTRPCALALTAALALASISAPAFARDEASPVPAPDPSPAPTAGGEATPASATAADLLASVPAEIEGLALSSSAFEAAEVLAGIDSDALLAEMAAIAAAHDSELDRFAIAGGGAVGDDAFISIIGGHLPGVPAEALQEAFVHIVLGPTDPELTTAETVAGQAVTVIRAGDEAGAADTAYVLPAGEVAWLVIGDETSLVAAIEALAVE